jgi:hypothetical protein
VKELSAALVDDVEAKDEEVDVFIATTVDMLLDM